MVASTVVPSVIDRRSPTTVEVSGDGFSFHEATLDELREVR